MSTGPSVFITLLRPTLPNRGTNKRDRLIIFERFFPRSEGHDPIVLGAGLCGCAYSSGQVKISMMGKQLPCALERLLKISLGQFTPITMAARKTGGQN